MTFKIKVINIKNKKGRGAETGESISSSSFQNKKSFKSHPFNNEDVLILTESTLNDKEEPVRPSSDVVLHMSRIECK